MGDATPPPHTGQCENRKVPCKDRSMVVTCRRQETQFLSGIFKKDSVYNPFKRTSLGVQWLGLPR